MTVKISKPAINLREELASLRNQGGLPKEDKLYLDDLVTNGDFSNGTTGWTLDGFTVSNGKLVKVAGTGNAKEAATSCNLIAGKTYVATFDYVDTGTNLQFSIGTATSLRTQSFTITEGTGAKSIIFTPDTNMSYVGIIGHDSYVGEVDNISVQEVGENLVTNGTFDSDSLWNKGTGWTISGGTASCDGSQTSNISFNQDLANMKRELVIGKQYTLTFTLSGHSGGGVNPHLRNQGYGSYITGDGTYTIVLTAGSGNDGLNFYVQSNFVGAIDNVIITEGSHQVIQSIPYGYDVKDVYIDGELAREGEAYDYQVKTDGINQWLKPTVEPTATTETVVIGVRK